MDVLLHLSLSSVILTDSSTGSPVHVLMLFIQAVRGLPRLRAPGKEQCQVYITVCQLIGTVTSKQQDFIEKQRTQLS